MTKTEMLIIRACKTINPKKRLISVYRRQYGIYNEDRLYYNLSIILSSLSEKYNCIKLSRFISKLNEDQSEITYWEKIVNVLIYAIRFTEITNFEGLIKPIPMRK